MPLLPILGGARRSMVCVVDEILTEWLRHTSVFLVLRYQRIDETVFLLDLCPVHPLDRIAHGVSDSPRGFTSVNALE